MGNQGSVGLLPSGGWQGESVPCLSPSLWWLLAILGILWPRDRSFHPPSPPSHGVLPCV